jgi:hypothetical protein
MSVLVVGMEKTGVEKKPKKIGQSASKIVN